jgi:hypothetical protein
VTSRSPLPETTVRSREQGASRTSRAVAHPELPRLTRDRARDLCRISLADVHTIGHIASLLGQVETGGLAARFSPPRLGNVRGHECARPRGGSRGRGHAHSLLGTNDAGWERSSLTKERLRCGARTRAHLAHRYVQNRHEHSRCGAAALGDEPPCADPHGAPRSEKTLDNRSFSAYLLCQRAGPPQGLLARGDGMTANLRGRNPSPSSVQP